MNHHFQTNVAWHGQAMAKWRWGEASGAGQGILGTARPRHWLRLKRHLPMAWPGHGLAMARSWPGQTRQHILGNDG